MSKKLWSSLLVGVGCAVSYIASVHFLQHKVIYMPRTYESMKGYYSRRCASIRGLQKLTFETSQGHQTAHFILPQPLEADEKCEVKAVWIFFNGNAGLGLDWLEFADMYRDVLAHKQRTVQLGFEKDESGPIKKLNSIAQQLQAPQGPVPGLVQSALVLEQVCNTAMLFVDYPGYGSCQGSPSPTTILESTEQAVKSFLSAAGCSDRSTIQFNVLGHSLGCAAALQWINAVTTPAPPHGYAASSVGRVVLMAPFTSLHAVASHLIGFIPLLRLLLRHDFDNERELRSFLTNIKHTSKSKPVLAIVHGTQDTIVPAFMGRSLATLADDVNGIYYDEIGRADHNNLIEIASDRIFRVMMA